MANIIDMPKLSDTMTVGTLVKWLKKEGETVSNGDIIAEVETDKATMELESFFDGTLLKIFNPAGSQVPVGTALCAIGQPGETVAAPASAESAAGEAPASSAPGASAAKTEGEPAKAASTPPQAAGKAPSPSNTPQPPTPAGAGAPSAGAAPSEAPQSGAKEGRIKISPLARKLAAAKGIDPAGIAGSGPGGRIVRVDIIAAEQRPAPAAAARTSGGSGPPAGSSRLQEEKFVPASNMRATVARRLLEAKTQIPHFYLDLEVDAGPLLELRAQLNTALEADGVKLSVNDFILKAAAEALRRVPAVNCSWEGMPPAPVGIRQHGSAHVSFAVAIEDGLITPVVRDADAKTLVAISKEAKGLANRAKEKKLAPAEYTGGTFCVSNLGMMGIDRFCAIINPPNACILAVGATVKRPVVKGDQIVIGQRMNLTLSCDHRVVDGAVGASFLAAIREVLEKPSLLLL